MSGKTRWVVVWRKATETTYYNNRTGTFGLMVDAYAYKKRRGAEDVARYHTRIEAAWRFVQEFERKTGNDSLAARLEWGSLTRWAQDEAAVRLGVQIEAAPLLRVDANSGVSVAAAIHQILDGVPAGTYIHDLLSVAADKALDLNARRE